MATFAGQQDTNATISTFSIQGSVTGKAAAAAYTRPLFSLTVYDPLSANVLNEMHNLVSGNNYPSFDVGNKFVGEFHQDVADEFFENYHVIPRSFDFGNILSAQTATMTIFSGYRRTEGSWSSFVNNAGAGTTLTGLPGLPATMFPLESYSATLNVSTSGAPTVDDDLAFTFDFGGVTISVPITLNRVVLFPVKPEIPYSERLQFLTDIIRAANGEEQRIAVRKNPRQIFDWTVRLDDGEWEKQRLDVLIYDWQARTWGIPMWHEQTALTVAASAGALTINVGDTDYGDYRVGDLVLVYTDAQTFDVQTVASFTSTTVTFDNALLGTYPVGTVVCPLRAGYMKRNTATSRFRSGDQALRVSFTTIDNDNDLGDVSGLDTFNGKVLMDSCNSMVSDTISETWQRNIIVIDNAAGTISQDSPWDRSKRGSSLTLWANTKSDLFTLRKFVHAMRGKQVSFYVPTYGKDLPVNTALLTASTDLVIDNIGYTQFLDVDLNRKYIWLRKTDGTVLTREITTAVETSSTVETLTMTSTWGQDIALEDIDRISWLEEVRFDTDEIRISYDLGERTARVSAPVLTTFDDS